MRFKVSHDSDSDASSTAGTMRAIAPRNLVDDGERMSSSDESSDASSARSSPVNFFTADASHELADCSAAPFSAWNETKELQEQHGRSLKTSSRQDVPLRGSTQQTSPMRMRRWAESSASKSRSESGSVWYYILFVCFMAAFAQDVYNMYSADEASLRPQECIYVPGGGFSGFWFTFGRLQSIPKEDRLNHDYYCYSAGCLAVVATAVMDRNMEDIYDIAHAVQQEWRSGTIDRYSVVRTFLDELLHGSMKNSSAIGNASFDLTGLSKIHIITTTQHDWLGVKTDIRTATNMDDLHEMLLQTTWIPFAVGGSLWQNGHMDGAFTALYHPSCKREMGLAAHPWLLANVINVNLPRSGVESFWNLGLEHGFQ